MNRTVPRPAVLAALTAAALTGALTTPVAAQAATVGYYTGVVVSPSGVPVPDVWVSAGESVPVVGRTDADGRFRIPDGLGFGTVSLCARLAQDAPQGGAAGWYDSCASVTPGTDATIRFHVGAAVGGYVIDVRTGRPLAGASVGVWDNNESYGYTVTTDARGHYRYRNLRPGAELAPVGANTITAAAPHGYGDVRTGAPTSVMLRAGDVRDDLGFQVAPLVEYSGTVTNGSGVPVAGARVAVQTYDQFADPGTASAATDAHGAWSLLRPWSGVADLCTYAGASRTRPTGLALTCTVARTSGLAVQRELTLTTLGAALKGQVYAPGGNPGSDRGISMTVRVPLASGGEAFPVPATINGRNLDGNLATLTAAGLPAGTFSARGAVRADHSSATAVGYSKPLAVTPGVVTTFPRITLQITD